MVDVRAAERRAPWEVEEDGDAEQLYCSDFGVANEGEEDGNGSEYHRTSDTQVVAEVAVVVRMQLSQY